MPPGTGRSLPRKAPGARPERRRLASRSGPTEGRGADPEKGTKLETWESARPGGSRRSRAVSSWSPAAATSARPINRPRASREASVRARTPATCSRAPNGTSKRATGRIPTAPSPGQARPAWPCGTPSRIASRRPTGPRSASRAPRRSASTNTSSPKAPARPARASPRRRMAARIATMAPTSPTRAAPAAAARRASRGRCSSATAWLAPASWRTAPVGASCAFRRLAASCPHTSAPRRRPGPTLLPSTLPRRADLPRRVQRRHRPVLRVFGGRRLRGLTAR